MHLSVCVCTCVGERVISLPGTSVVSLIVKVVVSKEPRSEMPQPSLDPMVAAESRYKGLRENGKGQRRGLDTVFAEIIWLFCLSRASWLLPATALLPPCILKYQQLDSY